MEGQAPSGRTAVIVAVIVILGIVGMIGQSCENRTSSAEKAREKASRESEAAAWQAVVAYIDARTPPGASIKCTKENIRVLGPERIEIDLVMAGSVGFQYEVTDATAVVVYDTQKRAWKVDDIYEQ